MRGHFVIEGKEGTKKETKKGAKAVAQAERELKDKELIERMRADIRGEQPLAPRTGERPTPKADKKPPAGRGPVLKEVNWSPAASRSSSPTTGTPSVRAAGT